MDLADLTMRAPAPGDVARLAALVAAGFDTYRAFAPADDEIGFPVGEYRRELH